MATKSSPSHCSKRACLCSPTNHPGSFRCSLHRSSGKVSSKSMTASAPHVNKQKEDRSKAAMMLTMSSSKSSLIRAFLMQIIRPSRHGLQRRRNFHPKPSRFSSLHGSANGVAVS